MPSSVPWSQDFFYNVAERALFGGHPVKTLRAYVFGERLYDVGAFARRAGLLENEEYRLLMSGSEEYHRHIKPPHLVSGWAYYDARHSETVVRITTVKNVSEDDENYPATEGKTFAVPGNLLVKNKKS